MPDMIRQVDYYYTMAPDKAGEGARLRQARRVPARLLGVGLSQLVRLEAATQPSLFESPEPARETERDRQLARVIDQVRQKFGPDALGRGGTRENA